jgi:hypothetical protein
MTRKNQGKREQPRGGKGHDNSCVCTTKTREKSQGNPVEERMHSEIPELLDRSNNIERLPLVAAETRLAAGDTFCS